MDASQALTLPPKPAQQTLDLITPVEVWATLTLSQQNGLLQTVVRICREAFLPLPLKQEAGHE